MQIKNFTIFSALILAIVISAHPSHISIIKRRDAGSSFENGEDQCKLPTGVSFDDNAPSTIKLACHESRNGLSKEFGNKDVLISLDRFDESSGKIVERMILSSNDYKDYVVQITFHQVIKGDDGSVVSEKDVPYLYKIDSDQECANEIPDGLTVADVTGVKVQAVDPKSTTADSTSTDPTTSNNGGNTGDE